MCSHRNGDLRSASCQADRLTIGEPATETQRHRKVLGISLLRVSSQGDNFGSKLETRNVKLETGVVIPIRDAPVGANFAVRVQPRARKNAIMGEIGDALKLALTAPPVEGRANEDCIEFMAELLKLPRSSVTIAAGQTSRNKVVRVRGLSAAEVADRLRAATKIS